MYPGHRYLITAKLHRHNVIRDFFFHSIVLISICGKLHQLQQQQWQSSLGQFVLISFHLRQAKASKRERQRGRARATRREKQTRKNFILAPDQFDIRSVCGNYLNRSYRSFVYINNRKYGELKPNKNPSNSKLKLQICEHFLFLISISIEHWMCTRQFPIC